MDRQLRDASRLDRSVKSTLQALKIPHIDSGIRRACSDDQGHVVAVSATGDAAPVCIRDGAEPRQARTSVVQNANAPVGRGANEALRVFTKADACD